MKMSVNRFVFLPFLCVTAAARGQAPGTKQWEFVVPGGGAILSSPALGVDGTVYFGAPNRKLYALTGAGVKRWEFNTPNGSVIAAPAIGADGTIYAASQDANLYAVDSKGKKLWSFATGSPLSSPPAIGVDGTIYLSGADGLLYAINSNGSKRWQFATGGGAPTATIAADGTIYVGHFNGNLYALNPNGSQKWKFTFGTGYYPATPAILDADGSLNFFAQVNGYNGVTLRTLYILNSNGTKRVSNDYLSGPFAINENSVRYGGYQGNLVAVAADGGYRGSTTLDVGSCCPNVTTPPALAADGTVYVSKNNILFAILAGAERWRFETGGTINSAPAIGTDGTVYFGSDDGKLYAVNGSAPLAKSSWPMYGRDVRHTGAVPNNVLSQTDLALAMYPGLTIKGNIGDSYRVEYRDGIDASAPWQLLASVTLDRTPYFYVDVNAANSSKRFYRAVLLPYLELRNASKHILM